MTKKENDCVVIEVKKYKTIDGQEFSTKADAEKHAQEINNPENRLALVESKIKELEVKITSLNITIERLEGKILALESKKFFPSQPHPDISPWHPFQQPFNPTAPTPKLPSEPGNVMYFSDKKQYSDDGVDLSQLSDEELKKRGYDVTYVGHKRAIIPHVTEFAFNEEQINCDGDK